VVWDAVYTPFGQVHSMTGTATNNQRFPGQYADAETGYSYNYFRDYDPTTGRYIESDPIGLRGGLNTYGYALNNSTRFFDPDGLEVRLICRAVRGPLGLAGLQHCFVHVSCPEEGWANTYSLHPTGYTIEKGIVARKFKDDPSDNAKDPNNAFDQPVTPKSCPTEQCGYEKAVRDRFNSFPNGDVPYFLPGQNSNAFAQDLITGTDFPAGLPPGAPGSSTAPGINSPSFFP